MFYHYNDVTITVIFHVVVCPDTTGQIGTCDVRCTDDSNCTMGQLCCSNGCGYACIEPVLSCTVSTPYSTMLRVLVLLFRLFPVYVQPVLHQQWKWPHKDLAVLSVVSYKEYNMRCAIKNGIVVQSTAECCSASIFGSDELVIYKLSSLISYHGSAIQNTSANLEICDGTCTYAIPHYT